MCNAHKKRLEHEAIENTESKDKGFRVITLEKNILEANEVVAEKNRKRFQEHGVCVLNLISSPGSGKTSLLVKTLEKLKHEFNCAVIEGDQQTSNDAQRIAKTGVPVVQINTNGGCHLNASQVNIAINDLPMDELDLIFIENVGNLVCPAAFDLGEQEKIVIMSVTEGEDKPIKYPLAFNLAKLMVITKTDLLPHLHFDLVQCKNYARKINPDIMILETSVFKETGMESWLNALRTRVKIIKNTN